MRATCWKSIIAILAFGLAGCGNLNGLDPNLKQSADATLGFWARLQGIQWHGNKAITNLNEENAATAKKFEVDGVASNFLLLSEKHSDLATELMALGAENVDQTAVEYRERLVAAHRALSKENALHATATKNRDRQALVQGQTRLTTLLTDYVQLCNEKKTVMATLKKKYDRDFDIAE